MNQKESQNAVSKTQAGNTGVSAKDSRAKFSIKSAINSKRIRLPPLESYENELEFICDGPSKIVVRLERLMGSNKARINDAKYMNTLYQKLQEEEEAIWNRRKNQRKKAEMDRHRQLIVQGKMEPGNDEASEEILKHPIFRVNKILNRLANLDESMTPIVATKISPKITPTEPFHDSEYLEKGYLFGFHKDHYRKSHIENSSRSWMELRKKPKDIRNVLTVELDSRSSSLEDFETSETNNIETEYDYEWDGEGSEMYSGASTASITLGNKSHQNSHCHVQDMIRRGSIDHAKKHYGINPEDNLEATWTVKNSHLVDELFEAEEKSAMDMYLYSKEVVETYRRKQLAMDIFVRKSHRQV